MEFKGTPGPWKYTVRNANEIMTTFHGVVIGDIYLDITTDSQKEDARLIAAAPEMIDFLLRINGAYYLSDKHQSELNSVINKALGRE